MSDQRTPWRSYKQLCDVENPGTLIYFSGTYFYPVFPYVYVNFVPNSPSCTDGIVCDIHFVGVPQAMAPTNTYSNDGHITVQAVSSYGAVRYSLTNVLYSAMTNSSGIFTGLMPGNYTIWARDAHNCTAKVTVIVKTLPDYNPKFRFDFFDIVGRAVRVDICERDFIGQPIDVEGGEMPFTLSKAQTDLQNKFEPLRPTFATINLASKKNFQFISLFTQDDRKYLVRYYRETVLKWSGFITPSIYTENFTLPTYITQIKAIDNIEQLNAIPFLDNSTTAQGNSATEILVGGNPYKGSFSLVQIVGFILSKLSLNINIRFAINMLEKVYNIKPVEAYIDADTFFDFNQNQAWMCDKVLKSVLQPFGAFVIQDDGVWNVIRMEEQCAPYDYLEYDSDLNYVGTGTNNKIIEIKDPSLRLGIVFTDIDQTTLEINPAYGVMDIQHNLLAKKSLLEDFDFNPFNFDGSNFKGWTIDRAHQKNIKITCEQIAEDTLSDQINTALGENLLNVNLGSFAFTAENPDDPASVYGDPTISGNSGFGGGQYLTLHSKPQSIEYQRDGLNFSFEYRFNSVGQFFLPPFMRIKFRIKLFRTGLGSPLYYDESAQTFKIAEIWNDVYSQEPDANGQFKVSKFLDLNSAALVQDTIQVSLQIGGNSWVDAFTFDNTDSGYGPYESLMTTIASIPTVALPLGKKIKVYGKYNFGGTVGWQEGYYFYELRDANGVDFPLVGSGHPYSYPSKIIAADSVFPYKYWGFIGKETPDSIYDPEFNSSFLRNGFQRSIYKFYIDNVLLEFKPLFSDPPSLEEISAINNQNYKENLSVELNAGDLPEAHIDSSQFIYNNFFRTVDGEITSQWNRNGFSETNTLQKILLKQLLKQYSAPTYKINGSFRGYDDMGFLSVLKHTQSAPEVELINPELDGSGLVTDGWQNYGGGRNWGNTANKAEALMEDSDVDSQILAQSIALDFNVGERFMIEVNVERSGSGTRVDEFHIVLLDIDANILQDISVAAFRGAGSIAKKIKFNVTQDCVNIGFYIKNFIAGGSADYLVDYFRLTPLTIVRYYYFNQLDVNIRDNAYQSEIIQLIPMLSGSDATIDDSGDNTGGGSSPGGGSFAGAYSSGYGSGFDSVLS